MEPSQILDLAAKWAPVLLIAVSLVNAFTEHHSQQPTWLRGIFAAIERLSVLSSKGASGTFKAPLSDKEPK